MLCPVTELDSDPNTHLHRGSRRRIPAGQPGIDLSGSDGGPGVPGRLDLQRREGDADNAGFDPLPCVGVTSTLVKIPGSGTEDEDKNPQRIRREICSICSWERQPLRTATRYKIGARLTAVNITNKYALYNFLSTFCGTHYVSPRSLTAQVSFNL